MRLVAEARRVISGAVSVRFQRAELDRIEPDAIANFESDLPELEPALGMLRKGHHLSWKALYIIHRQ